MKSGFLKRLLNGIYNTYINVLFRGKTRLGRLNLNSYVKEETPPVFKKKKQPPVSG